MKEENKTPNLGENLSESNAIKTVSFNPDGIPEALKERIQWVICSLVEKDGKTKKIPYTLKGYNASSIDPKTWTSYKPIFAAVVKYPGKYLPGFILTEEDPFIFLDYDHVIDPITGKCDPEIWEEIISLNTYTEISQSGTGIHVIGIGTIPGSKRRSGCLEMYQDKRAVALTGNHLEGTPLTVNEIQKPALKAIYEKIDPPVQKSHNEVGEQKQEVLKNISGSDDEVIKICENAKNGEKFMKLFKGIWEGDYKSQSEADLALCSLIASRTGNFDQIDRIFRKSGLYRSKWDVHEIYRVNTITKALNGAADIMEKIENGIGTESKSKDADNIKEKIEVSNQETSSKEPYIIDENRIYLNVLDNKGHHMFAYLGDSGKIEYSDCVLVDGRTVYPQELPVSKNGKSLFAVGIPKKELIESARTLSAADLFERIKNQLKKYLDLPEHEIELVTHYILFTWFYKKLNTVAYLRFIGDAGKGKTRMLIVIGALCFYSVSSASGSTVNGIIRFNELWHGTLKVNEVDKSGKMENDLEGYFNNGFEAGNYFVKNSIADYSKQEFFDPYCPKIFTMRRPFSDTATESRLISIYVRETTNPNIPILLPPEYYSEVDELRAQIAKFVLLNWTSVDVGKLSNLPDLYIEPRSKQLAIPLSIVLQLLPDKEKSFKEYFLHRQREITKIRSESWEGDIFNYVYSLAIGDESPIEGYENYIVDGKVVAITPAMVAGYFKTSAKSITETLKTIGFNKDSKTVNICNEVGSKKGKKTRMYVVPSEAAWREMAQRYLERDSESEEVVKHIPECPDVLKATRFTK